MANLELGNISTSLILDLSNLSSSVQQATGSFNQLEQNIKISVGNITQNVRVMADSIGAQQMRLQASLSQISNFAGVMGGALSTALGVAVKSGADLDSALVTIANNTSMTNDEIGMMTETVKKLGKESGASFNQLATGFRNIVDFGFKAKDAPKILEAAMKAALATGADVGQVAQTLAGTMHVFGFNTEQAAKAMNVLKVAAADGHMTLQQFSTAAGPTLAMAGSMGVSFTMVSAAFVSLTRHMFSASEASTQIKNVLIHLAEPGQAVRKILEDLSKRTGVDLVKSFTTASMSGKGMNETLDKIKETAQKAGVNADDLMMKLIHAMRGGLGAMVLAKTGATDFKEEMEKLDAVMAGKMDPTTSQYEKQQATLNAELARGRNEMQLASLSIEHALQPALISATHTIRGLIEGFLHLSDAQQKGIVTTAALVSGFLIVVSTIARVITVVNALNVAIGALGLASAGPVALGLLAAAAAAGLLYLAYNKLTESTEKTTQQLLDENEQERKSAEAKANNAREALTLAERYDKLKAQAKLTKDEHKELHDILNKISMLAPEMISGYDRQGNAIDTVTGAVRRLTDSLYENARAEAYRRSMALGIQAQASAQRRSELDEQRQALQAELQRGTKTITETSGGGYAGAGVYSRTHEEAFTPTDRAAKAEELRQKESQIAQAMREQVELQKQMRGIQAPFAPGHQGAHPADDLHKKELAAKEAENKRLKEEKEKLAHDSGLPNYQPPEKAKKGKKGDGKEEDMGDIIADHITSATKSAPFKASCAFFVSEVLKQSGVAVKGSNSVKELWKQLLEGGAEEVSSGFKRGDILKFHGKNFGTSKDAEGKGNHTGIYNGDGTFTDSHDYNSRRSTRSLADYMKANPDADVKALRLGDKDDRTSKMVENHNDSLEKQAEKRKEASQAELDNAVYMAEVKATDAAAIQALEEALHADKIRDNKAELDNEVHMQSVKDSDRKAIQAMDDAIFANKVKHNQEELDNAVYMEELKAKDTAATKALAKAESERLGALAQLGLIFDKIGEAQDAPMKHFVNNMKQNLEGILGNTFEQLFDGKSHQLFDKMLQNFVKMLEQMAAKALAMGIINLLTGGAGGFLGGAANGNKGGGFLGSFGFDDASNDKKAGRFGFDFARHFTGGMADYNNAHKPLQGGSNSRSAGDTHIHVNMPGMVVREHADIDHITDQLAWKIQTGLSGRFVGNGS